MNLVEKVSFLQIALFVTKTLIYKTLTMNVTTPAETRLKTLLPSDAKGFSVTGYMGTCRGSTPVMSPAQGPAEGQQTMESQGITFFVNAEIANEFRDCELDYDPALFGKGLTAVWPHRTGCACRS